MQLGIDSFALAMKLPGSGVDVNPARFLGNLLAEIELADQLGIDAFGVGEHHREEFLDSAPTVILGAAAARTKRIRLTSAVTVLSAADPVRVFEEFATLDLISDGRAEIVAGRGSLPDAFPLFGFEFEDYDELFDEKIELLLRIRAQTHVQWSGKHRPALTGQGVFPRPLQNPLPIWIGVGGSPESFARAGVLGLPLMIASIGGDPRRWGPLIDLYRATGARAGHRPESLKVGLHVPAFLGRTTEEAAEDYFPGYVHTMNQFGRARGWPPMTRDRFDADRGPNGPLFVGDAATVGEKILRVDDALEGVSRMTFQLTIATMPHDKVLNAIEVLGTGVAPLVRKALPAGGAASYSLTGAPSGSS